MHINVQLIQLNILLNLLRFVCNFDPFFGLLWNHVERWTVQKKLPGGHAIPHATPPRPGQVSSSLSEDPESESEEEELAPPPQNLSGRCGLGRLGRKIQEAPSALNNIPGR